MSSLTQLFPAGRNYLSGYEFDVVVSESHQSSITLTDHPVHIGAGGVISDHMIINPKQLTLVCFQSDVGVSGALGSITDFGLTRFAGFVADNIGDLFSDPVESAANYAGTRSGAFYQWAEACMNTGKIFDVLTNLKKYPSMVITSIGVVQDSENTYSGTFTITLREVQVASEITSQAFTGETDPEDNVHSQLQEKTDAGRLAQETVEDESALAKVIN